MAQANRLVRRRAAGAGGGRCAGGHLSVSHPSPQLYFTCKHFIQVIVKMMRYSLIISLVILMSSLVLAETETKSSSDDSTNVYETN